MVTHTHTHTHTYTHDNYYNPRCAHAHRGLIRIRIIESVDSISREDGKNISKMNKEVSMLLPKKYLIQVG